tara:strand:- start:2908 stop:3033 length:126 start_codon:yes stop_codon:yes gene_type:complete
MFFVHKRHLLSKGVVLTGYARRENEPNTAIQTEVVRTIAEK